METSSEHKEENVPIPRQHEASANQQVISGLSTLTVESSKSSHSLTPKSPSVQSLSENAAQLPSIAGARGGMDSPDVARLKYGQGSTTGIVGGSSPEMSAVQWGLVGSQVPISLWDLLVHY